MNELLTKGIGHTEFKDSELGEIPKSWGVKKLGEVGQTGLVEEHQYLEPYPKITGKEIFNGSTVLRIS